MSFLSNSPLGKFRDKVGSFFCLNAAQFLGALNDNIYKLLTIFLLISTLGVEKSSSILSAVGAIYVIPFLLFSSAAGILADRFSKQKLILGLKAVEVVLMLLSLVVFYFKSTLGCYALLFLLASHSAVFGPSKYGIIAELVETQNITKANGLVTSFTYLAMIFGTFLASFLTKVSGKNYVLSVAFCLLFSLCGFFFALGIKKTTAQRSVKKIHFFFPREIFQTIMECRKTPQLATCLVGSAFFLFIGAFTQLNIIPFAIQSLHLSEYDGGFLFLLCGLGIATGSFLTGKWLKKKANLGLSCLAGFVIAFLFFGMWLFSSFVTPVAIFLTLLGVAGGVFVISFDSFIQMSSSAKQRGQTIAAANFLSFFGVLIASFCLYFFGHVLGFSPASGFLCMSLLTFVAAFFLSCRLLQTTLPFFSKAFYKQDIKVEEFENTSIFLARDLSIPLLLRSTFLCQSCHILISHKDGMKIPLMLRIAPNVFFIERETSLEEALKIAKDHVQDGIKVYLFHPGALKIEVLPPKKSLFSLGGEEVGLLSLEKQGPKTVLKVRKLSILI